jgi:hypothetical protein
MKMREEGGGTVEPFTRTIRGRELGNAAACAQIAGIEWETFQVYQRRDRKRRAAGGWDERLLCPDRERFDETTGLALTDLGKVRRWQENRPGGGNWTAIRQAAARRAAAAAKLAEQPAADASEGDAPAESLIPA